MTWQQVIEQGHQFAVSVYDLKSSRKSGLASRYITSTRMLSTLFTWNKLIVRNVSPSLAFSFPVERNGRWKHGRWTHPRLKGLFFVCRTANPGKLFSFRPLERLADVRSGVATRVLEISSTSRGYGSMMIFLPCNYSPYCVPWLMRHWELFVCNENPLKVVRKRRISIMIFKNNGLQLQF